MSKTRWVEVTATITTQHHALFEVPNSISNKDVYLYVNCTSENSMHPFSFYDEYRSGEQWNIEGCKTVEDGDGFPNRCTVMPQKISVEDIKEFKDE